MTIGGVVGCDHYAAASRWSRAPQRDASVQLGHKDVSVYYFLDLRLDTRAGKASLTMTLGNLRGGESRLQVEETLNSESSALDQGGYFPTLTQIGGHLTLGTRLPQLKPRRSGDLGKQHP